MLSKVDIKMKLIKQLLKKIEDWFEFKKINQIYFGTWRKKFISIFVTFLSNYFFPVNNG